MPPLQFGLADLEIFFLRHEKRSGIRMIIEGIGSYVLAVWEFGKHLQFLLPGHDHPFPDLVSVSIAADTILFAIKPTY